MSLGFVSFQYTVTVVLVSNSDVVRVSDMLQILLTSILFDKIQKIMFPLYLDVFFSALQTNHRLNKC